MTVLFLARNWAIKQGHDGVLPAAASPFAPTSTIHGERSPHAERIAVFTFRISTY